MNSAYVELILKDLLRVVGTGRACQMLYWIDNGCWVEIAKNGGGTFVKGKFYLSADLNTRYS